MDESGKFAATILQPLLAVIRPFGETEHLRIERTNAAANPNSRKNYVGLWRERIDYSMDGSSCAFDHTVCDVLGRVRGALRDVFRCSGRPALNSANGNGDAENDRKQRFHSTK